MTMHAFVIGAILAFAGHTRADQDARMGNLMGKAFMLPAAPPQRSSQMSVHVGNPVAHGDRTPIAGFPARNIEKSIAQLRGEIFKLEKTNDLMKAELNGFRSQMAIMKRPQAKAMPAVTQDWRTMMNVVGLCIGAAFILSIIYKFFSKNSHRAPVVSMSPLDGADLLPSEATAFQLFSTSGRLRTAGGLMSEGEGCGCSDEMHSLEPIETGNSQTWLQFTLSTSTATALLHSAPRHTNAIRMNATDDEAVARKAWMERMAQPEWPQERTQSSEDQFETLHERAATRKRMLDAMGADATDAIKKGMGTAFGFGGADDTDYGYGRTQEVEERRAKVDLPDWMAREMPKGIPDSKSSHGGFDGRPENWKRTVKNIDPGPPPVEGTLRAPKEGTRALGPVIISRTSDKNRPPSDPHTDYDYGRTQHVEERNAEFDGWADWLTRELPKGTPRADSESSRGDFDGRDEG